MSSEADVKSAWQRIEAWYAKKAPDYLGWLKGPADAAAIQRAESELKTSLPGDFKASLLVHDGQDPDQLEVFGEWALYGVEGALQAWREFNDMGKDGTLTTTDTSDVQADPSVRPRQWDAAWIPIAADGQGGYLAMDLDPKDPACRGQVITFNTRSSERRQVAPSFGAWLQQKASDFESGKQAVDRRGRLEV